jgi:hypothetical protein
VLFHLRDDLWIGQLVGGLDPDNTRRQCFRAAETLLELQLGLTRPEDEKSLRLSQLPDDLVVVPVKMLAVAVLVLLLAYAVLRTRRPIPTLLVIHNDRGIFSRMDANNLQAEWVGVSAGIRRASSATPAGLETFLAHLFASRFAHQLIQPFARQGFPMTLPWSIDWSPRL